MIDEKQLEEIKKQFSKILENEEFTPDEEYGKELEEFINMNFSEDFENEVNQSMRTQTIKVKKLHSDSVFPKYNYPTDSGFDLHSVEEVIIPPFGRALVPTGLSFQFEEGLESCVKLCGVF